MGGQARVRKSKTVIWLAIAILVLIGLVLVSRIGPTGCESELQYGSITERQGEINVPPVRGSIFDRNFEPLAVSFRLVSMFARPLALDDPDLAAKRLAPVLNWEEDALRREFRSTRGFVWLASSITPEIARQVQGMGYDGIRLVDDFVRYYPQKHSGAHVIGFQQNEQGLSGLESQYDSVLRGETPVGAGVENVAWEESISQNNPGSLVLSIDIRSQKLFEKKLKAIMQDTLADQAMGLLMNPQTGEILALANLPSFNPNRFWEYDVDLLENRILTMGIDPGEMRRIFRLGAATQAGVPGYAANSDESSGVVAKVLLPQQTKEMRSLTPYGDMAWSFVQPGMYASHEITELPDPQVSQYVLEELELKLSTDKKSTIDLPSDESSLKDTNDSATDFSLFKREGKTTAIHLLTAFSGLISGQQDLRPHLVSSLWSDSSLYESSRYKEGISNIQSFPAAHHNGILDYFAEIAGKGPGGSVFFESLVELQEKRGPAENVLLSQGGEKRDLVDEKKYQGILLGVAPVYNPEITMLVVLDGAIVDLNMESIARREMFSAVKPFLKWHREKSRRPSLKEIKKLEKEIFASWQEDKKQEKGSAVPVILRGENKMPDVRGMSLRKALQKMGDCDLAIRITGAGRVVRQYPSAGSSLKGNDCLLELQMDE